MQYVRLTPGQRWIEGWITTSAPDDKGTTLDPLGASIQLPIILYREHDLKQAIGHLVWAFVTARGVYVRARLDADTAAANDAWQAITKRGAGFSVAFLSVDPEPIADGDAFPPGTHFRQWRLMEVSVVEGRSNPGACITRAEEVCR